MEDPSRSTSTRQDAPRPVELLTNMAGRMSRRDVLKRAVALGLSAPAIAALLAACGGSSDTATATKAASGGSTAAAGGGTAASGNTPASGGASPSSAGGGTAPSGGTAATGGPTGDTLVIGRNIDDLITFDPAQVYEISSGPIMWAVYQPMVSPNLQDPTKFDPVLCEEIPTTANGGVSADGLTYTFKLKKGVKFHSGKEMKASDWVYAFKRLHFGKKNPSFLADPFTKIDANDATKDVVQAEAVDDYTLKLTLPEANAAILAYLSSTNNAVYDADVAKANGGLDTADAEKNDKAKDWFDQNSAGSGPYKLTSFKNKEEVVLERFEDYVGTKPAYQKIVFKQIPDSGTALQQLEGGAIDFAMELDADAIKSLDSGKFDVIEGNSLNTAYLAMHHDPAVGDILSDKRVRQAIAYAIDYDAYVNDLRGGAAVRPASAVPLGMLSTDKVKDLAYVKNVDKAKQLIADAGADGKSVKFTYQSDSAYDGVATETIAAKLQADLEAIGLKVESVPAEAQQRLADYRAAKLQFTVSTWAPDYLDVHAYAFPFGGVKDQSPSKRIAYVDANNTQLLAQGIAELDVAKRSDIYVQVQKNMIDDAGFLVLWQPVFQYALKKGLAGVVVDPLYLTRLEQIKPPA